VNLATVNQTIQYVAWFIAIAELIVGLYILIINPRQTANRHVSVFLMVTAINSYAVGLMVTASNAAEAYMPAVILAMTTFATEPILLATTVALLKPEWIQGRKQWWWSPVYILAVLPAALTLIDIFSGTSLWYTPTDAANYLGGFVITPEFTYGSLSGLIRVGFILCFILIVGILLYVALFDKKTVSRDRRLAWLLFAQQFLAGALLTYFASVILPSVAILLTNTIFVTIYTYAAFQQMISEPSRQRGRLQVRLIAVLMVVTIPTMVAMTAFVTHQARSFLEKSANQSLQATNIQLTTEVSTWLDDNVRALKQLAAQPSVTSMDPNRQKLALEAMSRTSPEISLVSAIDINGMELARSDRLPLQDYSGHSWYQKVRAGASQADETIIDRTSGQHQLVVAVPIIDSAGRQSGVAMFATNLASLNKIIEVSDPGAGSEIYVIDAKNQVVAHSSSGPAASFIDFSQEPAVEILRQGNLGPFTFTGEDDRKLWRAKADLLPNSWATVVQISEATLLRPLILFERLAWITLLIAATLLVTLAALMIRQTIHPIHKLTEITAAVAAGDLTQVAPVESNDELGTLARTFNSMTNQIRDLVAGLERRVSVRTADLERRAIQLQVAAQVASEAAAIHDLHMLLDYTVQLISDRFGFYHAGIFLNDQPREYAVLASASSEGGHRMLGRGHKLKIGEVGIVGFVADSGEPRIALDVGRDAVFFNNPDLPQTRSEMAVPMKAHGQIIGVLDVQSKDPAAFTTEDVSTLQILADQIALAIENARLLEASQRALHELEAQYQRQIGFNWQQYLTDKDIGFVYDRMGIRPMPAADLMGELTPSQEDNSYEVPQSFNIPAGQGNNGNAGGNQVNLPIQLRGIRIGQIYLQRDEDAPPWTQIEVEMIKTTLSQVSLALENARLQESIRRRAEKERLANRIAARTQSSLDLEMVMKRAVQEIGQSLKVEKVQIHLLAEDQASEPSGNGKSGTSK
jgi:GAF domain-containing protein